MKRFGIITVILLLCTASLVSCGESKLYKELEGYWCNNDTDVIVAFTNEGKERYITIVDKDLEISAVTGHYIIKDSSFVINSRDAAAIGGKGTSASVLFTYDSKDDVLKILYNDKAITLFRFTVDLDKYPDVPNNPASSGKVTE